MTAATSLIELPENGIEPDMSDTMSVLQDDNGNTIKTPTKDMVCDYASLILEVVPTANTELVLDYVKWAIGRSDELYKLYKEAAFTRQSVVIFPGDNAADWEADGQNLIITLAEQSEVEAGNVMVVERGNLTFILPKGTPEFICKRLSSEGTKNV